VASRVLIVGGGIAGLSAAIGLRRANVDVDVVEADRRWAVDDIGMIVHANFLKALSYLDLADDAMALGVPCDEASIEDFDGNPLPQLSVELARQQQDVRLPPDVISPAEANELLATSDDSRGPPANSEPPPKSASADEPRQFPGTLGISRRPLHKLLAGAVFSSGANVRLGVTFTEIVQSGNHAIVTLSDGSVTSYDLVIGADGVHSKVRAAVFGTQFKPQFTGQYRWRCMVRRPKGPDPSFVRIKDDGTFYGYLPISARLGCVMLMDREPVDPACPPRMRAQLVRARLAGCTGRLAELREQIVDSAAVVCRPIETLFMPAPWYRGRVLLIGDASHSMTAHMAQGAVQAVEDGVVLSELFARQATVSQVLESFMLRRFARSKMIADSTLLVSSTDSSAGSATSVARVTERMLALASTVALDDFPLSFGPLDRGKLAQK
jgi:2-polyprenyl-6-methoxyphenol hydroxylase-like FAD-dependent oxidoreductase